MSEDAESDGDDSPRTETEPTMDGQPIFNQADETEETRGDSED